MVITLLANILVTVFTSVSQQRISDITAYNQADATLICTGAEMRWISASVFAKHQIMLTVEPPAGSQSTPPCPLFLFDDYHQEDALLVAHQGVGNQTQPFTALALQYQTRIAPLLHAFHSRAPPVFSV
jgi:hypothetical protein